MIARNSREAVLDLLQRRQIQKIGQMKIFRVG
jgi:hypothetical protein